jgi:peptidyl-prolyl cis-trans isomerase A (cyclophilin A)
MMRKLTAVIILALLAISVLTAACPRDKGDNTTVAVESGTPEDETKVVDASNPDEKGDTNVNIDVSQEGKTEGGDTATEGDKTADTPAEPGATPPAEEKPAEPAKDPGAGLTKVVLETSKGNIVLGIHEDWSPLGAKHFLELVDAGYYNGAPWFRVIKGFMCQCGIAADPAVTAKWQNQTIQDEPVIKGNSRGNVSFGKSGAPNSRSTHFFINYVDNSQSLDPQGFSAFAEVVEGMDVADKLKITGEGTVEQGQLSARGIAYFKEKFPDGDVIIRAYVKK